MCNTKQHDDDYYRDCHGRRKKRRPIWRYDASRDGCSCSSGNSCRRMVLQEEKKCYIAVLAAWAALGLLRSLNAGAISSVTSLRKLSLFGLEFMSTTSVKPSLTNFSNFFIASSALDATSAILSSTSFPTTCPFSSILRGLGKCTSKNAFIMAPFQ